MTVIPRYIITVDWADTGKRIPYDDLTAIAPKSMDYNHGANLLNIFSMVGLRGSVIIDDPDQLYDPLNYLDSSDERQRLITPHRFWIYQIDTDPVDPAPRNTGWAVIDRRPDRYTAKLRLASLTFEELQREIAVPAFNSAQVPTSPGIPPPSRIRGNDEPRVTEVIDPSFNDGATDMTFTVTTANTRSGDTLYYEFLGTGAPTGGEAILDSRLRVSITVNVLPNTSIAILADIEEGLPGYVGLTVNVPNPTEAEATASGSYDMIRGRRLTPTTLAIDTNAPDSTLFDTNIRFVNGRGSFTNYATAMWLVDLNRAFVWIPESTQSATVNVNYEVGARVNNVNVSTRKALRVVVDADAGGLVSTTSPFLVTNLEANTRGFEVENRIAQSLTNGIASFEDRDTIHLIVTHNGGASPPTQRPRIRIRPLGQDVFTTASVLSPSLPPIFSAGGILPSSYIYDTDKVFYRLRYAGSVATDATTQYEVEFTYGSTTVTTTATPPGVATADTFITLAVGEVSSTAAEVTVGVESGSEVYWRVGRAGEDAEQTGTLTPPSGQRTTQLTVDNLYPNRRYYIEFSPTQEFDDVSRAFFNTSNLVIGGIADPSLDFDQTNLFWRSVLGLPNLTLTTGRLPAGYIQLQHSNLTGVSRNIAADTIARGLTAGASVTTSLVETNPMSSVSELGRLLASRCVAGVFELCNGDWELVSRTTWPSRPNLGTFLLDDYAISENTRRSEIREDLAYSRVDAQVHSGLTTNPDGSTSATDTSVFFRPISDNAIKIILGIDRTLDITQLFTVVPEVPGWAREFISLTAEQTPLIVTVDVQATFDDPQKSTTLHEIEPSFNITVELPYQGNETALYTGMLMRRRVVYNESGTRPPIHQLTIWVDRITVQGLDILNWSTGEGWSTGRVWGAA